MNDQIYGTNWCSCSETGAPAPYLVVTALRAGSGKNGALCPGLQNRRIPAPLINERHQTPPPRRVPQSRRHRSPPLPSANSPKPQTPSSPARSLLIEGPRASSPALAVPTSTSPSIPSTYPPATMHESNRHAFVHRISAGCMSSFGERQAREHPVPQPPCIAAPALPSRWFRQAHNRAIHKSLRRTPDCLISPPTTNPAPSRSALAGSGISEGSPAAECQ